MKLGCSSHYRADEFATSTEVGNQRKEEYVCGEEVEQHG